MSEHAPLPASGAPIWGNCSGHILARADYPDFETEDTRRGTAGHWVAAVVLQSYTATDGRPLLNCAKLVGQTAPNGYVIDDEVADGAQVYVDDVLQVCQQTGGLRSLLIEHRVFMPEIHQHNWGTLDTALVLLNRGLTWPRWRGGWPAEATRTLAPCLTAASSTASVPATFTWMVSTGRSTT